MAGQKARPKHIDVAGIRHAPAPGGEVGRTCAVVVMATPRGYDLVFGVHALERARRRSEPRVPGYVLDMHAHTDVLHDIEQDTGAAPTIWRAQAAAALAAVGLPLRAVGQILGMSGGHAEAQRAADLGRRLGVLPADVFALLGKSVRQGHLRYLTATNDADFVSWCRRIAVEKMTVARLRSAMRGGGDTSAASADLDAYARVVSQRIGAPTRIHWPQDPKGRRVEITWYTPSDLQGVFAKLAQTQMDSADTTGNAKRLVIGVESVDDVTAILGTAE